MTLSSESSNKAFIILINKSETTITGDEASDSFVVLLKLNSDALSDGRVRLLGFNSNFLYNNSCSMGSSSEWLLPFGDLMRFLEDFVSPPRRRI